MSEFRGSRKLVAALLAVAGTAARAQVTPVMTVQVDCTRGETIAHALALGDERKPMEVVIRGTCAESVVIDRSAVTVRAGAPGAGVAGPDAAVDAVTVTGSRVTLDGIAVTGGRNGVVASSAAGLALRDVSVSATGRSGVVFAYGASGTVEGCTLERNPRDGIVFDAASGVVLRSAIRWNGRNGVNVFNNGAARLGLDEANVTGPLTVSSNGKIGIFAGAGGSFVLAASEVSGNGVGVQVVGAVGTLAGGNTVANNASTGVGALRGASVTIGDPAFGVPAANTIAGNGATNRSGGVFAFQGSAVVVQGATLSGNVGFNLGLSLRSVAQLVGSAISGPGDGIRLLMGSGLFVGPPGTTISGASVGVQCLDGESSLVNVPLLTFSGNGVNVAGGCTGF